MIRYIRKKETGVPFWEIKGEKIMKETKNRAGRDVIVVGFALFFHNFSTFKGQRGLYLEELFIEQEHRGKGYGKALLLHLVQIAVERKCRRMDWLVLDWNAPSIAFYKSLGAIPLDDWTVFRLTETQLHRLIEQ